MIRVLAVLERNIKIVVKTKFNQLVNIAHNP